MVKKIFLVFLILVFAIIIFSNYQKNNPAVKKMFDLKNIGIVQPTDSMEKSTKNSEKIFLQVIEPKNNVTVANQAIILTGKTISNGFVFVNDQEFKADSNGNFSTTVILEEGENNILVVVSDNDGNSAEKDIVVNLESTQ